MRLQNDAQLDGQHGIGNNTNDDIRDHSVVVCPFNDYRYTADPVLSTTEGVNYGREENREEQRKFLPRTGTFEEECCSASHITC